MAREYIIIGHRNRYWTIIKNAILTSLLKNILLILIIELRFYVSHLLKRNYFLLKVTSMVLKGISQMLRKRKEIQKRKKVSAKYMEKFFFDDLRHTVIKDIIKIFLKMV
jgi:predicted phage tail protein